MREKLILTLYTKIGCHLCEEMKQQLEFLQQSYDFSINFVDIETEPTFKFQYGERIPVLTIGEKEICYAYLDEEFFLDYIHAYKK